MNNRKDLCPWLACLYVEKTYRAEGLGSELLIHASEEVAKLGYANMYLSTDLEGYYEKYGWKLAGTAFGIFGDSIKVYQKRSG